MDFFRLNSLRWTQWIQQSIGLHNKSTEIIRSFSSIFQTYYFYFWIYPICQLIHPVLGHKMLFSFILSELACLFFKCIFHDPRPSWWFQTLEYSPNGAFYNTLYELPETCENTSGFPSVHTSLIAAFSIVIYLFYKEHMCGMVFAPKTHKRIRMALFVTFFILNEMLFLGRLFVATNFHYQMIAGTLIGFMAGNYASNNTSRLFAFNVSRAWQFLASSLGAMCIVVIVCFIIDWDPFWSVPLILNSCWTTAHAYMLLRYNFGYYVLRMTGMTFGLVLSNNYGGIWENIGSRSVSEQRVIYALYALEMYLMNWFHSLQPFELIVLNLIQLAFLSIIHVLLVSSLLPKVGIWLKNRLESTPKLIKEKYKEFRSNPRFFRDVLTNRFMNIFNR